MRRVVAYLRRLWRREQNHTLLVPAPAEPTHEEADYCFVAPSSLQTSVDSLIPYRSPEAATFHQYQCNYWEAPYKVEDSLTSWQWLDEHSFSRRYITRKEYSS